MKRSKSIKLVVMATTTVTLAACSNEPDVEGRVYKSAAECQADNYFDAETCAQIIEEGEKRHWTTGPRYDTLSLCNDQHGGNSCVRAESGGTSFFTPFVVGYFASRLADNALNSNSIRPLYPARNSSRYYTSGGYYVGNYGGGSWRTYNDAVKTPPKPAKVQTRTSVASRSGFGSRSSSGFRGG